MSKSVLINPGKAVQQGPGLPPMTSDGNPWVFDDAFADELVNRGVAVYEEPRALGVVALVADSESLVAPLAGNRRVNVARLAELPGSSRVAAPVIPWDSTMKELRRAIAAAAAEGRRFRMPRADVELTEPWAVDVSKVRCEWEDTIWRALHEDDVITFVGGAAPTYWNSMMGVSNFAVIGAGEAVSTSRGVVFADPTSQGANTVSGPNRIAVGNFVVTQCGRGIVHHDRSYGELVHNYAAFDCGIGVHMPPLAADAGEGTTHFKGFVFQCAEWGMSIEGTHGTFFHANDMHLDHNVRQIQVKGKAHLTMVQPHIEHQDYANGAPVLVGPEHGSSLSLVNPTLVVTKDGVRTLTYFADIQTPVEGGGLWLNGTTRAHKLWTNSGEFATGGGNLHIDGFSEINDSAAYRRFILNGSGRSALMDGGFEQSGVYDTLPDAIGIYADTAAINRRLVGANIIVSRNTAASGRAPRSGNGFLTIRHLGAAGTDGRAFIAAPLKNPRKRLGWRIWLRKPAGLMVGQVILNPVMAALGVQGRTRTTAADTQDTELVLQSLKTIATEPPIVIDFSTMADGWQKFESRGWGIVPALPYEWVTHGAIYIDPRGINGTAGVTLDYVDADDADLQWV